MGTVVTLLKGGVCNVLHLTPEIFKLCVGTVEDSVLVLDTFGFVETLACFRMPIARVRRTDRGTSQEVMEVAAAEVTNNIS
jgi:hypothetical protein